MIEFQKLSYQNFFSVGNFPIVVDFTKNEKTLITGKNGAGKSTFVSAICFALYGLPYKAVNKPTIVNSINKKGLLVEMDFKVGVDEYKIKRGIKPNVFQITHNGTVLSQDGKSKDYQNYLEKYILKMNFNTFKQIVVIGNTGFTPFMKLEASKRREMIENILDLEIFTKMNVIAKEEASNTKKEIDANAREIDLNSTVSLEKKRNIEFLEESIKKNNDSLVESLKEKIANVVAKLAKFPEVFPDVNPKITEAANKIRMLEQKKTELNSEVNFAIKEQKLLDCSNCPTCKQEIDEEFKQKKISQLNSEIASKRSMMEKITAVIDTTKTEQDALIEKRTKIAEIKSRQENLLNEKANFLYEIDTIQKKDNSQDLTPLIEDFNRHKLLLDEMIASKEELRSEAEMKKFALSILKDDGIKSKIVMTYIPLINKYINHYLELMNFYVSFEIDENFNEVIRSRHRDIFTYDNFSDGERSRIDLAFLFAWREITRLRNSISCNLLILDEVFSGSLDDVGIDDLMSILKSVDKSNVFVISHRAETSDRFDNHLQFEKVKNFTQYKKVQ